MRSCAYLSDLLDLGASFANQRAALTPRDHQAQGDRRLARHIAVCHRRSNILWEGSGVGESTGLSDGLRRVHFRLPILS